MDHHLDTHRLDVPDRTDGEEEHLRACATCRVRVRRIQSFLRGCGTTVSMGPVAIDGDEGSPDLADPESRYEDLGLIAAGGMGEVRRVHDRSLDRVLAMKLVRARVGGAEPTAVPDDAPPRDRPVDALGRRFLREAHLTARLQHPSIIPIHDIGHRRDGALYYTMKLVKGQTLASAIAAASTLADRLRLLGHFEDVCHALAYAHTEGVVHRDLKPQNVMIGEFGESVVLDWGLAKRLDEGETGIARHVLADLDATRLGAVIGTAAYMSPEQAAGRLELVDGRSDTWSLGAMLFELLTGHRPHAGTTTAEVLEAARTRPAPRVRTLVPDVPHDLAAIADKALAFERGDRYADARELASEVRAWRSGDRVRAYAYTPTDVLARVVRRHRAATTIGAVAALALATGASASYLQVRSQRDAAWVAERAATARSLLAESRAWQQKGRAPEALALLLASAAADPDPEPLTTLALAGRLEALGGLARYLEGQDSWGSSLAVSPDGAMLAAGVADGTTVLLDTASGAPVQRLVGTAPYVWSPVFSPDGRWLFTASGACEVALWDWREARRMWSAPCGSERAGSAAFSPDGAWVASIARDGDLRVWEAADGRPVGTLANPADHQIPPEFSFVPGGRRVLAPLGSEGVLWDPAGREPTVHLAGDGDRITAAAVSQDGRWAAAGDVRGHVFLWDAALQLIRTVETGSGWIKTLSFASDGAWLGWGADSAGYLRLPDGAPIGLGEASLRLDFAPGRDWILAGSGGRIGLWDVAAGTRIGTYSTRMWYRGLVWGPDGAWFAYSGGTHDVAVVTPVLDRSAIPLGGGSPLGWTLAWSPDGEFVAGSADRGASVWETRMGHRKFDLVGHEGAISALAWTVDQRALVSVSWDGRARGWSPDDGALRWTWAWPHPRTPLRTLAVSASGLAAVGGIDHPEVRLLSVETGELVREIALPDPLFAAAWSPDGGDLAVGTVRGTVLVFGPDGRERFRDVLGSEIETLRYTSDGSTLLASGPGAPGAWLAATGERVLVPFVGAGANVAVATEAPWVATTRDQVVELWRVPGFVPGPALDPAPFPVHNPQVAADGSYVLAGFSDGSLVWETETGRIVSAISRGGGLDPKRPRVLSIDPDGTGWIVDVSEPVDPSARLEDLRRFNNLRVCRDSLRVVPVGADALDDVWAPPERCGGP